MKKLLPLLLLGIVVAFAGCVGQGPAVGVVTCAGEGITRGIEVSDFTFDFNEIYGGEAVGLTFTAENMGGASGTLIGAELFGPSINEGAVAGNLTWGCPGACDLTDPTDLITGDALNPPNYDLDIPGDMTTYVWTLQAPEGLGAEAGYDFNIRTEYNYETNFVGILTVMSSSYLRTLPEEERKALIKAGGLSQQCYSGGPIALTAAAGTHFVDVEPGEDKTIRFKVTNVGGGYPFYPAPLDPTTSMYKVHINPTSGAVTCSDQTITLSRGQTGTFSCTFSPTSAVTNKEDITFTIKLDYNYWLDKSTFIKVLRPL